MVSFTPPFAGSAVLHLVKSGNGSSMYEDFTTFTEVDIAADRIQKTANHIDHRAERDETTYLYKDYGAAHFGDFEHKIKAKMVSGDAGGQSAAWMLANDLGNYKALSDGSKTYIYLRLQHNATDDQVSLIEVNSGTSYKDHNVDGFGLGDWIYAKLVKSGTSLTCYLYSDSGYSTLVDTLSLTLHADHSFRYLYGCNTYNDASNFHIITDVENFDIGETKTKASSIGLSVKESKTKTSSIGLEVVPPLSYEDFTTFTEVDVGADRIQKTKYHIDHLSYRDETTYLYKDYGAACFGDFEHRIKVRVVSTSEAWSGGHTWLLANDVAGAYWMESNNKTYLSIFLISNGSNNPRILLREMYNGTYYDDEYICSLNTWYYVKIIKSGTSINAYVYSDSDYSNLVDTLTLTLHANHTLQYLYGCNSDNDGSGKNGTLDILNFNIGETKTKASSIGLSIKDYGAMGCVMTFEGGHTYYDQTIEANNATINDVQTMFDTVGDIFYYGDIATYAGVKIKYSTKGIIGSAVIVLEYSKGSSVWGTLSHTDESNKFTEDPGTYLLAFTPPGDWATDTVDGKTHYWIRYRLTSASYTTNPKLDQFWVFQRETKESSASLSVSEQFTKESSASLSVSEQFTKESSASLTVKASYTKESSAGMSIFAESWNVSSAGLRIVERSIKESSAGLSIHGDAIVISSCGLAISEKKTKESSAGISIMDRIIKGNKERVQGLVFDVIVADGSSTKTEIKTNNNSINNIIATGFYFEVPQLSTPNKTAKLELLTTRDNVIFSSGDLNASTAKKYGFFVLRGLMDVTKYRVTTDANVTGNKTFNVEMRGLNAPDVSTMGLTVIDRITKESSASLTVKASYTKESSAGMSIIIQQLKQSSAGLTILGKNTLISSAGLTIFEPACKKGLFYGKLGDVILETVTPESFRISKEINRIPSFEFEVANSESNRIAIAANPTALFKIYWQHHGLNIHIFTGIINADGIEYVSLSNIRITGFASYVKLGWPLYKHLDSGDAEPVNTVFEYHGTYTDYTEDANDAGINDVLVRFEDVNHCLYVGEANPFWGLQIKYSTKGVPANAVIVVEFSKGSGVWTTLDVLDETNAFTEDAGTYDFIIAHPPSDWARNTVDGVSKFWLRWRIVSGAYTTSPKLDQIHTVNVDVYRVFYLDTSARAILLDVLDGTEYSMDATDACPEDEINLLAEYESPLRVIAAIPAALTWTDTDGSKKAYQWWIDDAKKVHIKQKRGTTHPDDITGDLTIFNNLLDYFNISNRLIGFAKRDGLSQIRAIVESKTSQTTHALREFPVPKTDLGNYITLKEHLEKDITYSKEPMQRIKGTVTTEFWGGRGYEVGDTVTLHQSEWVVEEGAFQIVKADIGPVSTQLNLGISREHLEGLKSNLKRTFDISNVQMHGSTTIFNAGPETSNYERKANGDVYSAKLKLDMPSDVKKTHKMLLSWTIGPYRASVNESTGEIPGHDHDGFAGAGGAQVGGDVGAGGAFIPDIELDGGFVPQMLSEAHVHDLSDTLVINFVQHYYQFPHRSSYGRADVQDLDHRHSTPSVWSGDPDDTDYAYTQANWDTWCDACDAWIIYDFDYASFALAGHWHSVPGGNTGYTNPSAYVSIYEDQVVTDINPYVLQVESDEEDPAHIHDGVYEDDHTHDGVYEPPHSDHSIPAEPAHSDHLIITEPGTTIDIDFGIHEEAAGTVLELLVDGEKVGEYSGNQTEIRIDGYLSKGASSTIEIQPVSAETSKKGGATIWASGILFIEPKRF